MEYHATLILVVILIIVLGVLRRRLIDRRIYQLQPHVEFDVVEESFERIYLPFKLWCKYYSDIWFICITCLFFALMFISFTFLLENNTQLKMAQNFSIAIFCIVLPLFLWRKRIKGLLLQKYALNISPEEAYKIVKDKQEETGWDVISKKQDKYIQVRVFGWTYNKHGELATLVFTKQGLFINSVTWPYRGSDLFTFGNNKSNVEYFLELLSKQN